MIGDFIASNDAQIFIASALLLIVGLLSGYANKPPVSKGRDLGRNRHGWSQSDWDDIREAWRTK